MHKVGRKTLVLAPLLMAPTFLAGAAPAQNGDNSTIIAVKVYPGIAMVERAADVSAATRHLSFACLPASLDVQSLAIKAERGAQLGEMQILTKPRAQADDPCDRSDIARNIRDLEQKKQELTARAAALQNVQDFVKAVSGSQKTSATSGVAVIATAAAIRTTTENAALSALQIERQIKAIDNQLEPLVRERDRVEGQQGNTMSVTVDVSAGGPDRVHLTYQVAGPGWTPSYRAMLDTNSGKVVIERQALVAQASGEDWSKVALTLATGQPGRNSEPGGTDRWRISLAPPPPKPVDMVSAPPPIQSVASYGTRSANADAPRAPLYDVQSFEGNFDSEFAISTPVSVPSSGLRVAMKLGAETQDAKLFVDAIPAQGTKAWLMTEINRPNGVLPRGKMSLYRDGAFIGETWYAPDAAEKHALAFGEDPLSLVTIITNRDNAESDDRTGTPGQRIITRTYQITNRHTMAMNYQVLEATPTTEESRIRIDKKLEPSASEPSWPHSDGVVAWKFDLGAGKSQSLKANYTINFPKSEKLEN